MEPMEPTPPPEPIPNEQPPEPQPPEPPPRIALRAILFAIVLLLVLSVVSVIAGAVLDQVTGRAGFVSLAAVVALVAAFVGAAWLAIATARRRPREYLPLAGLRGKAWIAAAVLGLGTAMLNVTLPVRLFAWMDSDYPEVLGEMLTDLEALTTPVGVVLLLGVLTPIAEEVLFRGVVLRSLLDRWGPWTAILVSSAIFGAFHLQPVHALIAFVLGTAAGWAMVATGSLWAAVAVHVTNNVLAAGAGMVAPEVEAAPLWLLAPAGVALAAGVVLLRPAVRQGRTRPGGDPALGE